VPTASPIVSNYSKNAGELAYNVIFNSNGTYYIWILGRLGTNSKGIHVGLDNVEIPGGNSISIASSSSFEWTNFLLNGTTRATMNITTSGKHIVNLWARDNGVTVKAMYLTKDQSFVPNTTLLGDYSETVNRYIWNAILNLPNEGNYNVSLWYRFNKTNELLRISDYALLSMISPIRIEEIHPKALFTNVVTNFTFYTNSTGFKNNRLEYAISIDLTNVYSNCLQDGSKFTCLVNHDSYSFGYHTIGLVARHIGSSFAVFLSEKELPLFAFSRKIILIF
jgi:hypothetical protein